MLPLSKSTSHPTYWSGICHYVRMISQIAIALYHVRFVLEHMCALFCEELQLVSCSRSRFHNSVGVIQLLLRWIGKEVTNRILLFVIAYLSAFNLIIYSSAS